MSDNPKFGWMLFGVFLLTCIFIAMTFLFAPAIWRDAMRVWIELN